MNYPCNTPRKTGLMLHSMALALSRFDNGTYRTRYDRWLRIGRKDDAPVQYFRFRSTSFSREVEGKRRIASALSVRNRRSRRVRVSRQTASPDWRRSISTARVATFGRAGDTGPPLFPNSDAGRRDRNPTDR